MTDYQIEDEFTVNPAKRGWMQKGGTEFDWDGSESVNGILGADDSSRYIKFLGKAVTQVDNIIAMFTFEVEPNQKDGALIGFFNPNGITARTHCFAMYLANNIGVSNPHIYIAYSDGTIVQGTSVYSLNSGDKYVAAIRYVPEDGKAYLEIFDFLTQQLLFTDECLINTSKTLELNEVGISNYITELLQTSEIWLYDMKAVATPEPTVYPSLYCTPEEARKMTNLDAVQDMSDEMLAQIERVYAMPQVDARFRSEGYAAPFSYGTNTPPMIKTVTAILTAAYAAKKSYTGHAQNESPNYKALIDEVNMIWDAFLKGRMELIDTSGAWIERTLKTSTDMLNTGEEQLAIFTLDDIGYSGSGGDGYCT